MLELSDWLRRPELAAKPWLVVGQGPTFACRGHFDLSAYSLWGLDHVARELRVDVAQVPDIQTAAALGERLEKQCRWLVMPRRPEINGKPGPPLESCYDRAPVLRRLAAQKRLVSYTALGHVSERAQHQPKCGTVEAAAAVIAEMSVRRVRSLGLDGGHAYSPEFADLEAAALRSIAQDSAADPTDVPARAIEELFHVRGIDHAALADPLRVFVAADDRLRVPARVLEYSIRKFASRPVVVDYMRHIKPPRPKRLRDVLRSTASLRRFAIPELCGYRGRALYLEPTAQVFADVAELWDIPFGPQRLLCAFQPTRPPACQGEKRFHPGRQLSVMLLDCARLHWELGQIVRGLDEGRYSHAQLTRELCVVPPKEIADTLPGEWNCVESHEPARSKLVHYAARYRYPWKSDEGPLVGLWMDCYREAAAAGAVPVREVQLGVAAGHLKQELLAAFEGEGAASTAALRLDLPHRLKLLASHRAKHMIGQARRLTGDAVRRWRSKA